jgi:hypothetical protein
MRQFHLARFAAKPTKADVESEIDLVRFGTIVNTEIFQADRAVMSRGNSREMLLENAKNVPLSYDWVAIVETEDGFTMDKNGHPTKIKG